MAKRKILCACGVKVRMPADQTKEMHIFTPEGEMKGSEYRSTRVGVGISGVQSRPARTATGRTNSGMGSGMGSAMGSGMGSVMGASGMGASGIDLNFEAQNGGTMIAGVAVKVKKAKKASASTSGNPIRVCPKCRSQVKANARVCNTCEADLGPLAKKARNDSETSKEADAPKVKCPKCGIKYKWRAELARKKVLCLCKLKFRIPFQPTQEVLVVVEDGDIKATEYLERRKKKEKEALEKSANVEAEARLEFSGGAPKSTKSGETSEIELDVAYDPNEENSKTIAAFRPIGVGADDHEAALGPIPFESKPIAKTAPSELPVTPPSDPATNGPPPTRSLPATDVKDKSKSALPKRSRSIAGMILTIAGIASAAASLALLVNDLQGPAIVCLAGAMVIGSIGLWLAITPSKPRK